MELGHVVVALIVVGVLLWLLQKYGSRVMDADIVTIIKVIVIVVVVVWLLDMFFGFGFWHYRVGR